VVFIAPFQGLRTGNRVNFLTQAVGMVPQGGIGRPVGAECTHPPCPAENRGEYQTGCGNDLLSISAPTVYWSFAISAIWYTLMRKSGLTPSNR